jgi:asparagine synthase (glutamine-hydrolysing)
MTKQIHRGPDGEGAWWNESEQVALGHNRLKILDLTDAGKQPMVSASGRYALTYNGEWYNFREYYPTFTNDAAALLQSIEDVGLAATISRVNGMFAFGLYDAIESKIHLVVDRFAQKPCYYTKQGDIFAFASSPAALLHLKEKWGVSETALASYWKLGSVMVDSIWEGISKVAASEWVTYNIASGSITTQRYWQPQYVSNTSDIEELILDSINKVKVSDVPIHIFLSGGVDSTLVASQFVGGNAIHLDGPEREYAQQVAAKFNLDLKVVTPAECDPVAAMNDYCLKCGEPSMAGLIPWITAKEAARFGKVAISANGADELFFGYDRTSQEVNDVQLRHIFRSCVSGGYRVDEIDPRLSLGRWLELQTYVQHDLNKTLDFASMAHSLEVRNPFLDHRLVEMALSLSPEQIGRKQILKNMLQRIGFSKEFTDRPKLGFSLYTKPLNWQELQDEAFKWCVDNRWLVLNTAPGKRDLMYLKASAFGFKQWLYMWQHKIE